MLITFTNTRIKKLFVTLIVAWYDRYMFMNYHLNVKNQQWYLVCLVFMHGWCLQRMKSCSCHIVYNWICKWWRMMLTILYQECMSVKSVHQKWYWTKENYWVICTQKSQDETRGYLWNKQRRNTNETPSWVSSKNWKSKNFAKSTLNHFWESLR